MTFLTMSQKEVSRYDVIKRILRKEISGKDAAALLSLSQRQAWRLVAAVREKGAFGLMHGNRGKRSNRRMPEKERRAITRLLQDRYPDFGPVLAAEKLAVQHRIVRDPKTIRMVMIDAGLWKPKRDKKETHRAWRQRKAAYGEMMQFDGSYHHWFEDRADPCCLLAAIDDATNTVPHARFDDHEGIEPVFTYWKEYVAREGKPRSVYLDKFSTYRTPEKYAKENHELKTQFQRAMEELAIEPISAHSPQAKGRIERLFGTLQDRLVKELRLRRISSKEEANRFLQEVFLPEFNARFARMPARQGNMHAKITQKEEQALDAIFSRQETRTVHNDFTVSYRTGWYQLEKQQPVTVRRRDTIIVEERLDGSIHFRLRGKYLNAHPIPKRLPQKKNHPTVLAASTRRQNRSSWKPPASHPWRQYGKDRAQRRDSMSPYSIRVLKRLEESILEGRFEGNVSKKPITMKKVRS